IHVSDPRDNPLNFIIPAFESLWRIVLRLLLEVMFATGYQNPEWQEIVVAFLRDPTKENFQKSTPTTKGLVSPEDLVFEALRLYPPTGRVRRAFKTTSASDTGVSVADIETCHIDEQI